MIQVCLADNFPIIHFGVNAFFKNHNSIEIVSNFYDFESLENALKSNKWDVLVVDLELNGLVSINDVKEILRTYPELKVLVYSDLSEQIYAPNALKSGVAGYLSKTASTLALEQAILNVSEGEIVMSETIKSNLEELARTKKSERLYRKLSNREIEVLRFLSEGKKNNEISKILDLNEKTISTYKLRLLTKLNVTNLLDLINKAKTLEIV